MGQYLLNKDIEYKFNEIHSKNKYNAIVVLSGGLDSSVALWWALDTYDKVEAIILDYNQPHKQEIECAKALCELTGIKYDIVKLDIPKNFWAIENKITRGQAGLMISIAALNISHDGADIVNGILSTDDIFGDCHRDHLDEFASVLPHFNDKGPIGIATPLRALKDKTAVFALGYIFGTPMNYTWSCRNPLSNSPCNECSQCYERNLVKEKVYDDYGIEYNSVIDWVSQFESPYHPYEKELPIKELALLQAFLDLGGIREYQSCWSYVDPFGIERIASHIVNPGAIDNLSNCGKICKGLSFPGITEEGKRWEIFIRDDKKIFSTEFLPPFDVLNEKVKEMFVKYE